MPDPFDPYHRWLGIPPEKQPANHYVLLAIEPFEDDPDVIAEAADRQMAHLRSHQTGKHSALSQNLLNEVSGARVCLLNAEKKAEYDRQLRRELGAKAEAEEQRKLAAVPCAVPVVSKPVAPVAAAPVETAPARPSPEPTSTVAEPAPASSGNHRKALAACAAALLLIVVAIVAANSWSDKPPAPKPGTGSPPASRTVTIPANSPRGFVVGPVEKGTTLELQYVSGKWKGWGGRADISPDATGGRGGKRCLLAVVALAAGSEESQILSLVPEGTKSEPFAFQLHHDVADLALRINDNDNQWRDNPGKVQYKLTVKPP